MGYCFDPEPPDACPCCEAWQAVVAAASELAAAPESEPRNAAKLCAKVSESIDAWCDAEHMCRDEREPDHDEDSRYDDSRADRAADRYFERRDE